MDFIFTFLVISLAVIFILTCFTVKDNRKLADGKKQWLRKYLPVAIALWVVSIVLCYLYNTTSMADGKAISLNLIFYLIFSVCNAAFLLYVRLLAKNSILFIVPVIPITILYFFNVLVFNKPTYNGAMDGFAALNDIYTMMLIPVSLPYFFFAFSMLKCRSWLKGVIMLFVTVVTGVLGVLQSVGYEGYIADGSGGCFVFIILFMTFVGVYYLAKDDDIKKMVQNKRLKPSE